MSVMAGSVVKEIQEGCQDGEEADRPPGEAHHPDSWAVRVRDKGPGTPVKRAYQTCAALAAMGNILDKSLLKRLLPRLCCDGS